jgi:hypothetical protein
MFDDLDATLAALLRDPSAPSELRNAETSFLTPTKDYNPAAATVNFFLYGLQENRDLHSSVPILKPIDHHYLKSAPPMRMDCTYLVTAWSSKTDELKVAEEHRLLGASLAWVSRFSTVPATMLQGTLGNPPQLYAVTTRLAPTKTDETLAHFWSALGIPPRPTFALTVTIAMQSDTQLEELPRVEGVDIEPVLAEHPALSGRVLDADLAPVAEADISVVENNQHTTSDQRGGFVFAELPFGTYTLLVRVAHRPDVRETITYRPGGQVHHVHLPAP